MRQEQQPQRRDKQDLRVHACLYFIKPTGHTWVASGDSQKRLADLTSLKPLDIEVMKRLGSRVNLIPVIAKADTMTPDDLATFKQIVSGI
jgi:cell division control protein 12